MRRVDHSLLSPSLGVHKSVCSLHYGSAGARPKVYVQASLHAEELPGMLVAHHLRGQLEEADARGLVQGEVILVPVANPIGLAQRLDRKALGRFEFDSSENFNRHYPALAFDADVVLDLHCDCEAVMHFYTEEACWPALQPLADLLQCEAVLLAKNSGGGPFDECLSGAWWQLAQSLRDKGLQVPLPQACSTTTIEFRGEADVSHPLARRDSQAIWHFLQYCGALRSDTPVSLPAPRCEPTPLAGSETLHSPHPGVLVFLADVGQRLAVGDCVAEVIDPSTGSVHRVLAGVAGVLYARVRERYLTAGGEVGKIAGSTPFRTGALLGA